MGNTFSRAVSEETYDPVHNVGRMLIDAAAQMMSALDRNAQTVGVSAPQLVVLIRLGGGAASTASELCKSLGYDSGAMTRMLDRLAKLGLVRRTPSPDDGRVSVLSLTDEGKRLYPSIKPFALTVLNDHLRGFEPHEVQQLMAYLQRIITNSASEPVGDIDAARQLPAAGSSPKDNSADAQE